MFALSVSSGTSSNCCFSATLPFMFDAIKLIKNVGLSMFFIAKVASVGILGDCSIICDARSFIELTKALKFLPFGFSC